MPSDPYAPYGDPYLPDPYALQRGEYDLMAMKAAEKRRKQQRKMEKERQKEQEKELDRVLKARQFEEDLAMKREEYYMKEQ